MALKFANALIAWRWPLLTVAALLTALAWGPASRLDFDRSVENMFAPDDPLLPPYRLLKRTFRGNEIVMAAYVDPQLMTPSGYRRLAQLTWRLAAVDGVAAIDGQPAVMSLTTTPLGEAILDPTTPGRDALLHQFEGYLVDAAHQVPAVVVLLDPARTSAQREAAVHALRQAVQEHDESGVLVGEPVMVAEGFRLIDEDGRRLGAVATVLLMLTIALCFRSLRWVLIPVAVVYVTLLWTQGLLVASQIRLSMVSSMLWAIITVVGIAMVIHVIVRFRDLRDAGTERRVALRTTMAVLMVPIFWACLTDAAGFSSLLAASVGPVKDFGLMMTVGALLAMVALAAILPAMALTGRIDGDPHRPWGDRWLQGGLRRMLEGILRHPWRVVAAMTIVGCGAVAGIPWLQVESDFTKNFRSGSEIVRSYTFVESRLGGAGVWDVIVPAPATIDEAYLDKLRQLTHRLRTELGDPALATTLAKPGSARTPGEYPAAGEPIARDTAARETAADASARVGLTKVLSLADIIDTARQMPVQFDAMALLQARLTPGDVAYVAGAWWAGGREGLLRRLPPQRLLNVLAALMPTAVGSAVGEDPAWTARGILGGSPTAVAGPPRYYSRIMLRAYERQPAETKSRLIAAVQSICNEAFAGDMPAASTSASSGENTDSQPAGAPVVTGFFVLLANLIESMLRDQWVTFGIATVAIGAMMLVAFRSLTLTLVALVPNILPILVISGVMGWLQVSINMGAAMIAAVSLGLAIDSSIHYITAFQRLRRDGLNTDDALQHVQQSVGMAVVFSTLSLIVGFSALCTSDFVPTMYFGVLVGLAMLGGLIGNLVLLPALLKLTRC